jgi:hypothetical protein
MQRNQPEYIEFVGIEDGRQTEICRSRSGTVLPASHPFWKFNWPPLHFGCRSTPRSVYAEEVAIMREANPNWDPTPDNQLTRDPAAKGFGANPIDTGSFYKLTPQMLERATTYGIRGDIEDLASRLGIKDFVLPKTAGGKVETKVPVTTAETAPAISPPSPPPLDTTITFAKITDQKLRTTAIAAFEKAPDKLRAVVGAHQDSFSYQVGLSPRSHYNPRTETLVLRKGAEPEVFAHEFGHGLDFKVGSHFSQSAGFTSSFQSDLGRLISTSSHRTQALGKKLKADIIANGWEDNPSISDLFSALTKGRIQGRWGHPFRYWEVQGAREAEAFADLLTLRASGNTALWNEVKAYVPELCAAIDRFVEAN